MTFLEVVVATAMFGVVAAAIVGVFSFTVGTQLREQRTEPVGARVVAPEGVGELVTGDRATSVRGEVGEREPALPAGQHLLDPAAVESHDEPPAELDARLRQGFAKVTATRPGNNPETGSMTKEGTQPWAS